MVTDDVVLLVETALDIGDAEVVQVERDAHAVLLLQPLPCPSCRLGAIDTAHDDGPAVGQVGQRGVHPLRRVFPRVDISKIGRGIGGRRRRIGGERHPSARRAAGLQVIAQRVGPTTVDNPATTRMGLVAQTQQQAQVAVRHVPWRTGMGRLQGSVGIVGATLVDDTRHLGKGEGRMDTIAAAMTPPEQAQDGAAQTQGKSGQKYHDLRMNYYGTKVRKNAENRSATTD